MTFSSTNPKTFDEGMAAYLDEQYESAIRKFSLCLMQTPDLAQAYYYRGVCWLKIGAPVSAEEDFSRALEQNPALKSKIEAMNQKVIAHKAGQRTDRSRQSGGASFFPRIRRALTV